MAPTEVPTSRSGATWRSAKACNMPTWIAPRLAPPDNTNAVVTTTVGPGNAADHHVIAYVPLSWSASLPEPTWDLRLYRRPCD